ncbi:MAG: hypothetical protein AAF989_17695, partial [Planctomycetota bacterium]
MLHPLRMLPPKVAWTLSLLFLWTLTTSSDGQDSNADGTAKVRREKAATEHCKKFWQSVFDRDSTEALGMTHFPLYGHKSGRSLIFKSSGEFRQPLQSLMPPTDVNVTMEISKVTSFRSIMAEYGERMKPEEKEKLTSVLKDDDLVFDLQFKDSNGKKLDTMLTIVGWREDEPKIVGLRD